MVLVVGIKGGVNGTLVLLKSFESMHKRFIGNCLSENFIFSEISCVIMNKKSYMYDVKWDRVGDVLAPHIFKMMVSVVSFVFICYDTYSNPLSFHKNNLSYKRIFH